MKRIAIILLLLLSMGCASMHIPPDLPAKLEKGCESYNQGRELVLFIREQLRVYWMFFPQSMRDALLKLDAYLPIVDETGKIVCVASEVIKPKQP